MQRPLTSLPELPRNDAPPAPPPAASHRRALLAIAMIGSVIIVAVAAAARLPSYRVSPVFLLPLLWLVYLLRRRIDLHPAHYALFLLAICLHDFGAFGMYQRSVLGLSFDIYVHFYFAFAVSFMLHRALVRRAHLGPWAARVTTLMFMMGFGALHEIMEYASYLLLGERHGMLRPSTSYFFDTQRDLLNNLLGTLLALLLMGVWSWMSRPGDSHAPRRR